MKKIINLYLFNRYRISSRHRLFKHFIHILRRLVRLLKRMCCAVAYRMNDRFNLDHPLFTQFPLDCNV